MKIFSQLKCGSLEEFWETELSSESWIFTDSSLTLIHLVKSLYKSFFTREGSLLPTKLFYLVTVLPAKSDSDVMFC